MTLEERVAKLENIIEWGLTYVHASLWLTAVVVAVVLGFIVWGRKR